MSPRFKLFRGNRKGRNLSPGRRLERVVAGIWLAVATLACLVTPFLALEQGHRPFPGFLVEPTRAVSRIGRPEWAGLAAGLRFPQRIVGADGLTIRRPADLYVYLRGLAPGSIVRYDVEDLDGQRKTVAVPVGRWRTLDLALLFWGPYVVALTYLSCGLWVFHGRAEADAAACTMLCAGIALSSALFFDAFTGQHLHHVWALGLPLTAAGGIHLALLFPQPLPGLRRRPGLAWLGYLPAAALIAWDQRNRSLGVDPEAFLRPWRWTYVWLCLAALVLVGSMLWRLYFPLDARVRRQARAILIGSTMAFLPAAFAFLSGLAFLSYDAHLLLIYGPLLAFPMALAYAVAREQLLDLDYVLRQGLVYSLLVILATGAFLAIVLAASRIAPGWIRPDEPVGLAFLIILAAILVAPLQRYLREAVDRLLYRERVNFRRTVQAFAQSLGQLMALPELCDTILQRIVGAMHLDRASLYLFEPSRGHYRLYGSVPALDPAQAPVFHETDRLVTRLHGTRAAVPNDPMRERWLNTLPEEERQRVARLQAAFFLPLSIQGRLVGWLNLGEKRSGERYDAEELELLEALADRAAVAVENARLFSERERRVRQLAALNEIGREINAAHRLSEVLEAIYELTGKVLDTTNFELGLYDSERDEMSFPIATEDGQRVFRPPRRGGNRLGDYLIRTKQPLLIREQVEETVRSLGLDGSGRTPTAWMGVPIVHAGRPLGFLAVHSHDPERTFEVEDLTLLSAVANQAAVAIENARLIEQMDRALDRRLEELSRLARFARTLACVALDPRQVAEETLEVACEAIEATQGALVHCQGEAQSCSPLVTVEWPSDARWHEVWQALLPALLEAEEPVLALPHDAIPAGAPPLEGNPLHLFCPLIREDNLLAFLHLVMAPGRTVDEDARLFLRHVADHAAVALENALLYQQLVQQRDGLDRRARHLAEVLKLGNALRANMELDQVLQLVVEAIRDTLGFRIVLLSLADEEDPTVVRRAAAVGLDPAVLKRMQAEHPPLAMYEAVMRPEWRVSHSYLIGPEEALQWEPHGDQGVYIPDLGPRQPGEWNERCALFVPLRGRDRLLGILSVDDPADRQVPSRDTIEMLEIFANQAATAIENARLYQALRQAYEAKGEFLSRVAHELQVPMGTIWGYAELIEQEGERVDVGTLRGFLAVLKSNIARLDALVKDLLEVSRIEAGRIQLRRAPLYLQEVALECAATWRPRMERKGLRLELDLPDDVPAVEADRERMVQVLDNLLSNAYKYTPAPGTVVVRLRRVEDPEQIPGDGQVERVIQLPCIVLTVQDTGIGLSRQDQRRLFTRFFRSDHPLVRQEEGTGLGLHIAWLLVRAHGGHVWVKSEPGQGATFYIALPAGETHPLKDHEA